jgi:hypothetical protein
MRAKGRSWVRTYDRRLSRVGLVKKDRLMKPSSHRILAAAVLATIASTAFAGTLGFEEEYALAPDRTVPLKQLVPGTADYYYYSALQAENTGDFAKAQQFVDQWLGRDPNRTDPRLREMENRQALLTYDANNQKSLDYLQRLLGLTFSHERETLDQQRALPTALDPALISRTTLTQRALSNYPNRLEGFENSALNWLDATSLGDDRLHEFLTRLERPDLPGLVQLINRDLGTQYGANNFTLTIHRQLLLSQLDELVRLRPTLLNDSNFVNTYLARLRPANGVDWQHDPKEETAYFDRLWAFASRLGPVHNSLKASILYQRLVFDRTQNVWDKDRFLAYVQLPKNVPWMRPEYLNEVINNQPRRSAAADLNRDYSSSTLFPPIRQDDPLVRSYLLHFFVDAADPDAYREYIESNYLQNVFAEAKIVNGIGDQEKWYAMASNLQALRDRVDIDFAYTNKPFYQPDDSVGLDLYVKNVKTLLVKVYDINTAGYYKANRRELGTDMPLDGLVANRETVVTYDDPPLRRVARHFDFPELDKKRGAYMVEFIGNGISSRALVIKGKLHYLEETGSAGHVFTILDEKNQKVDGATLWMAGHEYAPKDGRIIVPFSTAPGPQPIVLQLGDFASFDRFTHDAENYTFKAGFEVDREELIRGGTANVFIRPMLYINGEPVSLRLLDDAKLQKTTLTITSIDREGTPSSKEIPDFPLLLDRETTYKFQVPDNLASVSFNIRAQVKNLSQNKNIDLADNRSFSINAIDASDKIEDVFLSHLPGAGAPAATGGGALGGQYVLDVLGKTGEPLADRPVNFAIKHKDFRQVVNVTLKSDAKGRIMLGTLEGIASFTTTLNGVNRTFTPVKDQHSPIASANAALGKPITLPYMGTGAAPSASELSLLELRDGFFYADRFSSLKLKDGLLSTDDLPQGDYSFRYRETGETVSIHIAPGIVRDGWVLAGSRFLQQRDPDPLQIATVSANGDNVTIKLVNATKLTRVHVVATRYLPDFPLYASLGGFPMPPNAGMTLPILDAQYVAGRNIGDEYRYILDRKYANIFPGNSLDRPGLLLDPWSVQKTETGKQLAAAGEAPVGGPGAGSASAMPASIAAFSSLSSAVGSYSSFDFLPSTSVVLPNLVPDANGLITIPRRSLGDRQEITVLAVDLGDVVSREMTLPETALAPRDLRLKTPLDVAKHFTEQKQITIVRKGAAYSAGDTASSAIEAYDSVARVYKLYATLSKDPTLAEFAFIVDWPKLTKAQKQEKYSKYACHELNFFLSRKDPDFFNTVIAPYLKNKKDKTFMDHYLLKDDLAAYVKPSEYDRLNIAEQTLLGERIAGEQAAAARHVKDRYDLLPPDIERFNYLFRTALQGGALEQAGNRLVSNLGVVTANAPVTAESGAFGISGGGMVAGGGFGGGMGGMGGGGGAAGGRGGGGGAPAGAGRGGRGGAGPAPAATPAPAVQLAQRRAQAEELASDALRKEEGLVLADKDMSVAFDMAARDRFQALYLKVDKTEEWAENNYYHVLIQNQNAGLIPVNAFWRDYAAAATKTGFLTTNLAEGSRNFSEMMIALGVLDLPFESPKLDVTHEGGKLSFTAPGPMVVFHRETAEAPQDTVKTPILVSQNFFRASDRYTYVDNEKSDKYVSDEFLTHVVYGCQVVVTNPTSSRQKLDVLLQIPQGALPANNGLYTRGVHTDVDPFQSKAIEYYFYFPSPSGNTNFVHYPVQVARNEKILAFVAPAPFKVVDTPSKVDTTSWDYISQNGTTDQVLQYLKDNNIDRLNLDKIAWRMKDGDYFKTVTDLLAARHVYSPTLWSYSIKNNNVPAMRDYLQKADALSNNVGPYVDCKLLTLDPVVRRSYQFLEYSPLINARAHKMGRQRQIVNEREFAQYENLLAVERYRPAMNQDDLMSITYYLLLQDRIDEAKTFFAKVDQAKLPTQLQYDYFTTYLDFYNDSPKVAPSLINKYKDYPVDRWRELFASAGVQLAEINAASAAATRPVATITTPANRNQQQGALAATAPNIDFKVEDRKVTLNYQNVTDVHVNYYKMDIELMFSQNPFLGRFGGQFSSIRPNRSDEIKLDASKPSVTFDLPSAFTNSNVMIEITADGVTRTQAYYPNSLNLQFVENYGQVKVASEKSGSPLPKVYIKVYARKRNGQIEFFKDGYTDLRGRFEYASLSTNDLDNVDRFSVLVLSDTEGAVVREVAPPKQ